MHIPPTLICSFVAVFTSNAGAILPIDISVINLSNIASSIASSMHNRGEKNMTDPAPNPVDEAMDNLEKGYFGTSSNANAMSSVVFNGQRLDNCITQCGINHTTDSALVAGNPDLPKEVGLITFSICNRAMVKCNRGCLSGHQKEMEDWPPGTQNDQAIRTFFSNRLPTCINGCNREATSDTELITERFNARKNATTITFGMCNSKLSKCNEDCQGEFNEEVMVEQRKEMDRES